MATISPIHLRAPLSIPPYISEAKGIWRHHVGRRFHLTQSTFPTSRNAGGIRSFSTAFSACIEQRSTCNKTKQKKKHIRPGPVSDSLPAPLQDEGARTLYAELRSAAPSLGQKAVHGGTNCPCTASSSPTERAVQSSSSATIGKRATVRQTRARGATATGRWREGQERVLPSGTVGKYIKYDVGRCIDVINVHYCTTLYPNINCFFWLLYQFSVGSDHNHEGGYSFSLCSIK